MITLAAKMETGPEGMQGLTICLARSGCHCTQGDASRRLHPDQGPLRTGTAPFQQGHPEGSLLSQIHLELAEKPANIRSLKHFVSASWEVAGLGH